MSFADFVSPRSGTYYDKDKWAFQSNAWKEAKFEHVNLTQIHRQSDKVFIGILNRLRTGVRLSPSDIDLLLNHKSETRNAIQLFATRQEVKTVNDSKFKVGIAYCIYPSVHYLLRLMPPGPPHDRSHL